MNAMIRSLAALLRTANLWVSIAENNGIYFQVNYALDLRAQSHLWRHILGQTFVLPLPLLEKGKNYCVEEPEGKNVLTYPHILNNALSAEVV